MLDFVAYTAAQHRTNALAREALPDAPVQADTDRRRRALPTVQFRLRVSQTLRRLADLVEPGPANCEPGMASSR